MFPELRGLLAYSCVQHHGRSIVYNNKLYVKDTKMNKTKLLSLTTYSSVGERPTPQPVSTLQLIKTIPGMIIGLWSIEGVFVVGV